MEGVYVGFNSEEALIDCFKLSLHFSKQYFKEVHLVTDNKGKELIQKYGLKFDKIDTGLEEVMKGVNNSHWALGKIYACKIQDKPFIHIDTDVIWFKKPAKILLEADAAFQELEYENLGVWYETLLEDAGKNYKNKPKWFNSKSMRAYNCGIIAFNKLDILQEWWDEALNYVEYLKTSTVDYTKQVSSLIFEQFFVYHLCQHYGYKVELITNTHPKSASKGYIEEDVAKTIGYTHLISTVKRNPEIEKKVKNRVKDLNL